jgi:hypothetical protein
VLVVAGFSPYFVVKNYLENTDDVILAENFLDGAPDVSLIELVCSVNVHAIFYVAGALLSAAV